VARQSHVLFLGLFKASIFAYCVPAFPANLPAHLPASNGRALSSCIHHDKTSPAPKFKTPQAASERHARHMNQNPNPLAPAFKHLNPSAARLLLRPLNDPLNI